MDEKIHPASDFAEQLKVAGTDLSKQVPALLGLGEWYLKKAKTTANGADFTKADALYNAALVRSRLANHEIGEEQIILTRIVETYQEFLYALPNELKVSVDEIRNEIDSHKKFLANERRIIKERVKEIDSRSNGDKKTEDHYEIHADQMHDVFRDIQNMYIRLVSMLTKECVSKLGQPPCNFAIIALGSVARMEATPYSDLEFAILYSDPGIADKINYFRVLSYFLHLKVINLGETILPALGIEELNNFEDPKRNWFFDSETPRGISFDGAMPWASKTPLGRKATKNKPALELIRTPQKMAELQDEETAVKEGYHLADIMVRVSLLYGDRALVDEYNKHVADKLNAISSPAVARSNSTVGRKRGIQQLSKDIDTFFPLKTFFGPSCAFNAKKDFYRLISLLLSDLALIFNIRSPTPWQVISELQTRGIIDETDMMNIKVCLSIANEIRLKTYLASSRQKEVLSSVPRYSNTAKHYPTNSHFYQDFDEDDAARLLITSVDIYERCTEFYETYKKTNEIDLLRNVPTLTQPTKRCIIGHLYIILENYPKAFELLEPLSKDRTESAEYMNTHYGLGLIYSTYHEYEKCIECFEEALKAYSGLTHQNDEKFIAGLSVITSDLAEALNLNGEYKKALSILKEAICKHNEIYGQGSRKPELRRLMRQLGVVYSELGKYELASQTFEYLESMLAGGAFDGELFDIKVLLALSFTIGKKDCSQALQYAEEALNLANKFYGNENPSLCFAATCQSIAMVYERCCRVDEALSYYEKSLKMFNFTVGDNPHPDKIECLMNLGRLHLQIGETNKAIGYLENALEQAKTSFLRGSHFLVAKILYSLADALKRDGRLAESLKYSIEAKEATDKISGSTSARMLAALTLKSMGGIYNELGRLPEAQKCLEDTLAIYSEMYEENNANKSVLRFTSALTYSEFAWSGDQMEEFAQLKRKLTKAAKIYKEMPITNGNKCFRAVCNLFVLSTICENHGDQDDALEHLKEARNVAKANSYKHEVVVDALYTLCEKYLDLQFFDEFIICVSEAIEMRKSYS
ncbi:uncharacterized protein LOC114523203 [Dendronephthya gigantea]|uniref:uncharacterized protein LOC114523203 n=1 Tax=Dendronephthya gigantea TaxID=151771 RepID=UPI001068F158|nr:uncharacterized protein LOC114523203 [Dendronephthya gigantea]